jgi:conjugative relaxase-like TrwC/TraI family protein
MTIHVLHAGNGYTYLTRSVAAHDARLGRSESLADYYVAKGQPPGRWAGSGAAGLHVSGVVTEEQMRNLFGEGRHPDADGIAAALSAAGASVEEALQATRLGRRFPQYRHRVAVPRLVAEAYAAAEQRIGRTLSDSERLSVRQHALAAEFLRVHGRPPLDPVELDRMVTAEAADRREAVAGYDLVFTPVKSVAVLWGIGSEATRRAVFEAHRAAVADAVSWLEANASFTRSGDRGQAQIDTAGVIAAQFDHWDSRAGDPDLHTHVAVSNKVQGTDGTWRSLDGRALFAAAVSLSERYNTRIEDELGQRLGVTFTERTTGTGDTGRRPVREVDGVPTELIHTFSKRRQGIEQVYQELLRDYRDRHHRDPDKQTRVRLYQQATLAERPAKTEGRSLRDLVTSWKVEANTTLGVTDAAQLVEAATLHRGNAPSSAEVESVAATVVLVLETARATWTEHHVRAEAHRQLRPFAATDRDALVEATVSAACRPDRVLRIETPRTVREPAELCRASGESVFVEHASARYTTLALLDAEERIIAAARQATRHRVSAQDFAATLDSAERSGRHLNAEQQQLARAFVCSDHALLLGLAPAGSGKTTTMRVVVDAWTASGRPVVALAPSAVAAEVLRTELGAEADTLAKFDHDRPHLAPGTLLLVDEAGMAGTMILDRLVARARAAGAVLRLLGDDQQLAAVEAGGVIRHLASEVGAVRMFQVVRFADPAEGRATLQVRDGDPAAVDFYTDNRRIVAATSETAPDAAYTGWLADARAGRDTLLLAPSSREVAGLNGRARADLVAEGRVDVDGVRLRDGNAAGVGDRVCTRRNNRRLGVHKGRDWVKNGDPWTVEAVHDDGALTVVHRGHGGRVTLPPEYVAGQVELDYARTIRRAQGATVDRAHLLVDPGMAREDLYVGLSRARHGTTLYVAIATDPGPGHPPEVAGTARDVLAGIIGRSGAQPSATEAVRDAVAAIGDLRRMAVEYEHALGTCVGDHYRVVAERVLPGVTTDRSWPSVAGRLHFGEAVGQDPEALLRKAAALGGLTDARSEAQVLVFRLDLLLTRAEHHANPAVAVPSWLAAGPPRNMTPPWDGYLPARYAEMDRRIGSLADQALADRPPWLAGLGADGSPGQAVALRQTVAYRAVYGIHGDDPLGPEPDQPGRQRQAWRAASGAIAAARTAAPSNADRLLATLAHRRPDLDDPPCSARTSPTRHL